MAKQYTTKISINGWKNVWTILNADGYTGAPRVKSLTVANISTVVTYIHFTSDGATSPATAANGLPFSTDTAVSPSSTITMEGVDLCTTWINTASAQNIIISVING